MGHQEPAQLNSVASLIRLIWRIFRGLEAADMVYGFMTTTNAMTFGPDLLMRVPNLHGLALMGHQEWLVDAVSEDKRYRFYMPPASL
jgi:hypothetical protein